MLKRILKSIAWRTLTSDIYYREKQYHAIQGRTPNFALVKAWKKESYAAFMKDPNWTDRIAFKGAIIIGVLLLLNNY